MATGAAAGVVGIAITWLLHAVQHAAFGYTENTFLVGVDHASPLRRVLVLMVAGVLVGTGWWLLRHWTGVVSVTDVIDGPAGRLPVLSTTLDAVLQVVAVGMGTSLGREGAPRQVSAAIGGWLAHHAELTEPRRRIVIAAGAGAGLAAVYNVPLGGALFACEVLLRSWSWRTLLPAALVSAVATVVSWLALPNRPIYQLGHLRLSWSLLAFALAAGPVCAVAGWLFSRLMTLARSRQPRSWHLPIACLAALTGLGLLAVAYPELLGNGKGPTQLALDGTIGLGAAAALFVLKPLATAACLGVGIGGGLLTPALASGALLGTTVGQLWNQFWPGPALGAFALVAAAATLAVTQQAPLCAIALTLEFTHPGLAAAAPVIIAVLAATTLARPPTRLRPTPAINRPGHNRRWAQSAERLWRYADGETPNAARKRRDRWNSSV